MTGPHIGVGARRRRTIAFAPATDPGVLAVLADGWSVNYASPPTMQPDAAPRRVAVMRQGFAPTGAPTLHAESLILTQRVRQPYPNHATLDAARVALSDYVYATDVVLGAAANGSAEASPKPIAAWALPDRTMCGNLLRLEVVAAHRNARQREQVACVVFSVTDGVTTLAVTVGQSTVLSHPGDLNPVIGYAADIDVSTLLDGPLTANAKVCPWIGAAASVLDSAAQTPGARAFAPQTFYKNAARFAAPPLAYVAPSGVDAAVLSNGATAGGVQKVSAEPSVAAANPFATIGSAMSALKAAVAITGGACDGCEIRLMAGANAMGAVAIQTYVTSGELVITRDPATTRDAAILNLATTIVTRAPQVRLRGLTIARTSTSQINLGPNGRLTLEDVVVAGGGAAALHSGGSAGATVVLRALGLTAPAGLLGNATGTECRLLRGVSGPVGVVDPFCVLGCRLTASSAGTSTAYGDVGNIVAFNRFMAWTGANPIIVARADAASPTTEGYAIVQNVVEWSGAQAQPAFRISADGGGPSTVHVVCHHNTFAGAAAYGRGNLLYVDTAATGARTHRLMSFKGNIHVQINTKHDVFAATPGNVGGWAYMYGVGCAGELTQFADAAGAQNGAGGSFSQAYAGLAAKCGASATIALNPLFVAPASAAWNGAAIVAGAGNGDYALQPGSPAAGMVASPVLRFDLAGAARPAAADAAGAFAA